MKITKVLPKKQNKKQLKYQNRSSLHKSAGTWLAASGSWASAAATLFETILRIIVIARLKIASFHDFLISFVSHLFSGVNACAVHKAVWPVY